jgi:ribosome-interacting GTPase 1
MDQTQNQIKEIEEEIRKLPYHKGTERHIGMLRARLAILKDKQIEAASRSTGGGGGYAVKKQGDATVVLVGPPSAGKSTLINALTNAESKVAPYAFTTVSVIPGMMKYKNAQIQILDVPGLIEGAEEGKGRGREVLSVVRGADLLVMMSDPQRLHAITRNSEALERNGIRINKAVPDIKIEKSISGGLLVHSNIKQELDKETIKDVIIQMGIKNGDIYLREKVTMDQLIDALSRNRVYIPALYVVNKIDLGIPKKLPPELSHGYVGISATKKQDLDRLQAEIWKALGLTTIFLVKPNEEPSEENPTVVHSNYTLQMVAEEIGSEFLSSKTKAKIWGNGAKFPAQEVSLSTVVKDGMMVRFI